MGPRFEPVRGYQIEIKGVAHTAFLFLNIRIKELRELVTECYLKYSNLGCDMRFFSAYHLDLLVNFV